VITPNRSSNVTAISKAILAVHEPTSVEEIISIVRAARASRTPLYPVSTGFNWGYGSRSPIVENCALVDLGRMNRILNAATISVDNPIAVIEPGVTQIQLYEFLQNHCPELAFNVTGSGRDTSIIGNALDRGVGYNGPRKDDIFGLEIITGTGDILRTGFRRLGDSSPLAHTHPFGLGPILDGLFFQSNFGIVTSACFRLFPRRPKEVVVSFALRRTDNLPIFINELARLKRDGLLTSVTHIANHARTRSTLSSGIIRYLENECGFRRERAIAETDRAIGTVVTSEWTSMASVTGNRRQVKAALQDIRRRICGVARSRVITDGLLDLGYTVAHRLRFIPFARANAAAISAIRPLHKLALGTPTDAAIENLLWTFDHSSHRAVELDQSRCGLLFINPALPLDGRLAAQIIEGMKSVADHYGHTLYATINIETTTSLVAIVNLLFDRTVPEEIDRAHKCADALLAYIRSQELEPYRARADMMDKIVMTDPGYWGKIRALKQVFDPDNIIAPGRYNIA
jgi:4-cresol dehydrogenase (hydroxylating)